jgi:nitrate reductase gamma subunit
MMELVMGAMMGVTTLVGLTLLLHRRLTDKRISVTGSTMDVAIATLIWVALIGGMATLPASWQTRATGEHLHALANWAQRVVTLRGGAVDTLVGVPWVFKAHMLFGMTVFLVFPFTRLVHVCSAPLGYLMKGYYQIVRARRT